MLINNKEKSHEASLKFCEKLEGKSLEQRQVKVLPFIWALILIFIRHGNQELYYHICGDIGKDSWDCPMEAEGLSVRMTNTGKKVTLW